MTLSGKAQTDVTKFLGIPVDGSKTKMIKKLKAKGFKKNQYVKDVLTGEFNGRNVNICIVTNHDKVYRIVVADTEFMNETDVKMRFNVLCDQFQNSLKYVSISEGNPQIPEDEEISYEMTTHQKCYEASFYQLPDTATISYKEIIQAMLLLKYTEESSKNLSYETLHEIQRIIDNQDIEKILKKSVWFKVIKYDYDKFYIIMCYDNEYNEANGEDL
ncbi:MAG: hypothetical protein K2H79_06490 [Bacteroidaceae bacterium]|nr:hypothetical protein [Bacteroidaceae bacterium]